MSRPTSGCRYSKAVSQNCVDQTEFDSVKKRKLI